MIKLSDNSIQLITVDGNRIEFETEELQGRIINSCLDAGIREVWIAEDIALSVEYALRAPENQERTFSVSDINGLVVKILENTGYPDAAESFRLRNEGAENEIESKPETVSTVIRKHLGLSGKKLEDLTGRVLQAAESLGIKSAVPNFFLELARHYREHKMPVSGLVAPPPESRRNNKTPWLVSPDAIKEGLSENTSKMLDSGIIGISGVSRLFPAIKITLRLVKLVDMLDLNPPVTEMSVLPGFVPAADTVNEVIMAVKRLAGSKHGNKLPLYLQVADAAEFAERWLEIPWPKAEPCCRELLDYLSRMLDQNVFKLKLR